jgi:branched-chain amino acid transport system ATP-binding protein
VTIILEVRNLTKSFGGVVAVKSASIEVEQGSITAIIGPNGAGKTSLFNVITGFEPADSGGVYFEGQRIDDLLPWEIAQRGLIRSFQTPVGFPVLSVWENLMVAGIPPRREFLTSAIVGGWHKDDADAHLRAKAILSDLDLWDTRDSLLQDLPPGDVKLVDFARLSMARPKMMLLDEPASGVDIGGIGSLTDLIKRLNASGITVLVIDHNIGFVLGIADQVNVMALGEVIAKGRPGDVVENEKVMEVYLGKRT